MSNLALPLAFLPYCPERGHISNIKKTSKVASGGKHAITQILVIETKEECDILVNNQDSYFNSFELDEGNIIVFLHPNNDTGVIAVADDFKDNYHMVFKPDINDDFAECDHTLPSYLPTYAQIIKVLDVASCSGKYFIKKVLVIETQDQCNILVDNHDSYLNSHVLEIGDIVVFLHPNNNTDVAVVVANHKNNYEQTVDNFVFKKLCQ
jgi:hypothetical protein